MKARFSYPLAFLLPCAMVAFMAAVVFAGVGGGVVWLFIYGDNSWPSAAESTIMALSALVAVISFAALISASYYYGKRKESVGGLSKWHVAVALASTILLPAIVLLRQYRIGALGS